MVFNSAYANNFIDYETSCGQQVLNYFFPFSKPIGKYKVKGQSINVEVAPEPSDIIWTHFGYSERNKILRKVFFTFLALLALMGSAAINYGLEVQRIILVKDDK